MNSGWIVFTDLDGTLLDHHSYSYAPALPSLKRLEALGIPVVLCTSKTRPEVEALHRELGLDAPYITENGGCVVQPRSDAAPRIELFGTSYRRIDEVLQQLRSEGFPFRRFADFSPAELAKLTGLSADAARLAAQRESSEPLLFDGDAAQRDSFRERIETSGLRLVEGGRFFSVMGQTDKAKAMRFVLNQIQVGAPLRIVALGDSPNDAQMLTEAHIAVVIPRASGPGLELPDHPGVLRPRSAGPRGWHEAMKQILDRYIS